MFVTSTSTSPRSRRAFTLIEATISVLLVGVLMVAVVHTVSAARLAQRLNTERSRGLGLAQDLLSEILTSPAADPDGSSMFGVEDDETPGDRRTFDDVDDYAGWSAAPPQIRDGTDVVGADGFERSVKIMLVEGGDAAGTAPRLVTVAVRYAGREVARLEALRTAAWSDGVAEAGS